ncbi:hypothetical protein BKG82_02150 [Mycobacteroides chelonae]|uniref:Head-to-tail adaptor n=1 Tax=Mycobacteroides chelonae TaxID=1774 RepID=A0A1S1LXW7_MYCCH|nr:hypothetical protein [Mycobacteroides chelonae]OHU60680.1 hypothetical protein BKG82_02150 [Mycobacteroides chelonae]
MAELTPADVEQYTRKRLDKTDAETARLLAVGLSAVRQFCGWHVSPVKESHEVELDGPGGRLLALPTLKLIALTEVTEDGKALDVSTLYVSKRGLVRKKNGGFWSPHYGAITVTMNHGVEDADAFNAAVLSFIDRLSKAPTGGDPIAVGPFRWAEQKTVSRSAFSATELSILEQYRLESPA